MNAKSLPRLLILLAVLLQGCNSVAPTAGSTGASTAANPAASLKPQTLFNSNTDWFKDAKYGTFLHWWWSAGVSPYSFDVNGFADDIALGQPGYHIFTLGQNGGYYNAPNSTYDTYAGYAAGARTSSRDLPNELYTALNAKGIKLMLYLPASPANCDAQAAQGFGYDAPVPCDGKDGPITLSLAYKWAAVIREWSDRYGSKVAGWWFDGAFDYRMDNNEREQIFALYAEAAKHGNPNSIVTFNNGQGLYNFRHISDSEDYTAGELNDLFSPTPPTRWLDGSQVHILTYLADNWGQGNARYNAEDVGNQIKNYINPRGGVISMDVAADSANGRLNQSMKDQLSTIKNIVRGSSGGSNANLAIGATLSASSSIACCSWDLSRINDAARGSGGSSNGWTSDSNLTGNHTEWVQFDLGSSKSLSRVDLYPRNDAGNVGQGFPIDFAVQTSTDGSNWTGTVTRTGYPQPGQAAQSYRFTPVNARYVRVLGSSLRPNPNDGNRYRMQFAEVEIYAEPSNLATNGTVNASSTVEYLSFGLGKVKDGERNSTASSTAWSSDGNLGTNHSETLTVDLGTATSFSSVSLSPRNDTGNVGQGFPIDFAIETSTDGTTWTAVTSRTGFAIPGNGTQVFSFNPVTTRYARVRGTNLRQNPSDGNLYRMQFAEIELL